MKHKNKLIALILSVITIVAMFAIANAGSNITGTSSATEVKSGDTFTFTVAMNEQTISSLGATVSVSSNLEIVSAKWLKNGVIASYDASKNKGAFTPGGSQAMSGDIFEVTVRAKTASNSETVNVEIVAKNGSTTLFTEKTSKTIKIVCASHNFSDYVQNNDKHTRTCSACGYTESASHKWNSGVITTEPTCTKEGTKTYTCESCPATKTESVAKKQHKYSNWTNCSNTQHEKVCEYCNDSVKENHAWDKGTITKDPTCAQEGEKTYKCSKCSATKTESIAKTNDHTYGNWNRHDDNSHSKTCSLCKDTVLNNHKWNAGVVTRKPTCSQEGVKTYTCTDCKATKTESIKMGEHTFDNACDTKCNNCDYVRTIKHNYSSKWFTTSDSHEHRCTVCGTPTDIAKHVASDWIVDKQPTDKTAGKQHIECTICKYVMDEEVIPSTGCKHGSGTHLDNVKAATCTEEGYTGDMLCNDCNSVMTKGTAIAKLDHDAMILNDKEATCSSEGYTGDNTCVSCGTVLQKGEAIPKTEHNVITVDALEATCTDSGKTGDLICSECKVLVKASEDIPAIGHDYKDGTCTVCGHKDETVTPPETSDPNETTPPATGDDPNTTPSDPNTPDTGSSVWIWIVVAIVAAGACVTLIIIARKKRA